jgi:large subunit ribosomal protein L29
MKASELRQKTVDDLRTDLYQLRKEQVTSRMQRASGELNQTHVIGEIKKDISRIKTVMAQKLRDQS